MSPILGGRWSSGGVRCPPATPEPPSLKAVYPQVPGGGGEWTTSLLSPREADATAEGPSPALQADSLPSEPPKSVSVIHSVTSNSL